MGFLQIFPFDLMIFPPSITTAPSSAKERVSPRAETASCSACPETWVAPSCAVGDHHPRKITIKIYQGW
jgi:hypothetical protein